MYPNSHEFRHKFKWNAYLAIHLLCSPLPVALLLTEQFNNLTCAANYCKVNTGTRLNMTMTDCHSLIGNNENFYWIACISIAVKQPSSDFAWRVQDRGFSNCMQDSLTTCRLQFVCRGVHVWDNGALRVGSKSQRKQRAPVFSLLSLRNMYINTCIWQRRNFTLNVCVQKCLRCV